jgi:NitT/TauT family transport system substrate-binding protein
VLAPDIDPADLKGKNVSAPVAFIGHLLMGVRLDSVGVTPDDVEWVNLNADEAAGYVYEPWSSSVQANLEGSSVATTSIEPMYLKNAMFADSIYTSKDFIADRRGAAVDMMRVDWDARAYWNQHVAKVNLIFSDYLQWPIEDIGWVVSSNGKEIVGGLYMYDFDEAARFCGVLDGAPPFDQANGGLVKTVADINERWIKLDLMETTVDVN